MSIKMCRYYLAICLVGLWRIANAAEIQNLSSLPVSEKRGFYKSFVDDISDDKKYSDEDVIEIIKAGMRETDEVVRLSLNTAVAFEALQHYYSSVVGTNPLSSLYLIEGDAETRDFSEFVELKEYLLSGIEYGLSDDLWVAEKKLPAWWLGYVSLSIYFSKDNSVEELLIRSVEELPMMIGDFLEYMNYGSFSSDRINEIRFDVLRHENPELAIKAAMGIASVQPERGIYQLTNVLYRRDVALAEIVKAIAAYGEKAVIASQNLNQLQEQLKVDSSRWPHYGNDLKVIAESIAQIEELNR